jgi:amino acid transporter
MTEEPTFIATKVRRLLLGRARSATEPGVFHKLSLVALLAWICLGSNGISSSCYGPEEAFRALGNHAPLAIFLAAMTAVTVFVITASYMQIIELFPNGGGAYLVASKLLSPAMGMVAGSAVVAGYVLTITVSVACAADAIFSLLPAEWTAHKITAAFVVLILLVLLNLRGVQASVTSIIPIFVLFLLTHAFVIVYGIFAHAADAPAVMQENVAGFHESLGSLGLGGMVLVLLHAYSMGGGTYTGIEAVSDSMGLLQEPRVATGKRTMLYMAISLAFVAGGLIVAYLLLGVRPGENDHRTLNAVLFGEMAGGWGKPGEVFVAVALISEALILLVAAQTGFLGGPAVLACMGTDGWMPRQFSLLSDRLVTQNGILLMGAAALGLLWLTGGDVRLLVILYSINVFLTFTLAQTGMVRHWWQMRDKDRRWARKMLINGVGVTMTGLILLTVTVLKWKEGGWKTIVVTAALVAVAILIKRHYNETGKLLRRLDTLFTSNLPVKSAGDKTAPAGQAPPEASTAVILVGGFNGLGLHTLFNILRIFRGHFTNFVFIQVGVIDAGRFKGSEEIENLTATVTSDVDRYVQYMRSHGYYAEGRCSIGTDVVQEVASMARQTTECYRHSVVFTGQLVFPGDTLATRVLHNHMSFAIQKQLYYEGIPVLVLPVRM